MTEDVEGCISEILDAGFEVHRALGPGYLESIYRRCLAHALRGRGLAVEEEVWLPVEFQGLRLDRALRADLVVNGLIVEVKSIDQFVPVHRIQLLSYLKASGAQAGVLMNFNVALFKEGYDCLVHPELLKARKSAATP